MARPRAADGGDGLQIWKIAANVINKQSRTANKEWSPSLGVGHGANKPRSWQPFVYTVMNFRVP